MINKKAPNVGGFFIFYMIYDIILIKFLYLYLFLARQGKA